MNPIETLKQEHRVIEQVLDCLEAIAREAEANRRLDVARARDAVTFIREFADRCHHGKEEHRLFPMLERHWGTGMGPVAVMRMEHEEGRACVRAMSDAIDTAESGGMEAIGRFVDNARAFVRLLREHIQKEDQVLFPAADRTLEADEHRALAKSFDWFEREDMGEGAHAKYLAIANALATHYGIPRTAPSESTCGHCH
jgi:hemerythrin-like domain-containing protein